MSDCYQTLLENNRMLVESNAMLNNKIMKILTKNKLLGNQILEMNIINENYRETQINNFSKIQKYKKENSKLKEQHEILSKTVSNHLKNTNNTTQGLNIIPFPIQFNMPYQFPNQNNHQNYFSYSQNLNNTNNNTIQQCPTQNPNNILQNNNNHDNNHNVKSTNPNIPPPSQVTPIASFPSYKKKNENNRGNKDIVKPKSGNITLELKNALQNHKDSSASNILKNIKKMRKKEKN